MNRLRRWWGGLSRRSKVIVSVITVFVLLALAGSPPPGDQGGSPSPSGVAPLPSPIPTLGASPSSTPASTPQQTSDPTPQATAEPQASFDFDKPIPGLAAVDVTKNLEDRGFDCTGPEPSDTGVLYECKLTAPEAEHRVLVLGTTPERILLVDSTALDFGPNPGDSAKAFLEFMATIPCEGCDPAAAQQWVRDNFDDGGEQVVGTIILTMYGDPRGKILEIRAAP